MSLRSDTNAGLITCGLGIAMVAFGSCGLVMGSLQRLVMLTLPLPPGPQSTPFKGMMDGIYWTWSIYLPLMILGGIVFAVSGYYMRRGSVAARRFAQVNALGGYAWGLGYGYSCWQMAAQFPQPPVMPLAAMFAMQVLSGIGGFLMLAAFPTTLLWLLVRPKANR